MCIITYKCNDKRCRVSLFYFWTLNNDTDKELVSSLATNYKLAGSLAQSRPRVGGLWTSPAGLSRPRDGPREASSIGSQSTMCLRALLLWSMYAVPWVLTHFAETRPEESTTR